MSTATQPEQPRWIASLPTITVVGYVVLALALMLTGQSAGYSYDTMERLVEHIAASAFFKFWIFMLISGLFGESMIARFSRADINKSHFGIFLLVVLWTSIGIALMVRHGSASVQSWCFGGVAFAIGWSMALEYLFVAHRKSGP